METKDKVKTWYEEHTQEIRDMAWYTFGLTVGGVLFYYRGKRIGRSDGLKEGDEYLWSCFGKEYGKDKLSTVRNDDSYFDAICRPEFIDLIYKNCERVIHDDGYWDFKSEVE